MNRRGPWILAIVTGGVGLGGVLGLAADPEPKPSPDPPWKGVVQASHEIDPGYRPVDPRIDPDPYPDSYAPSWADEDLAEWEPEYPAWSYSALTDQPSSSAEDDEPAEAGQAAAEAAAEAAVIEPALLEPPPSDGLDPLY